jgi:16S rRNA (cytidine1402-2'-O)-methyltransferase
MSQKSYNNSPTLYLIPTPIGNMDDITLRAIKILELVDLIYAEDTRVAHKLLKHLNLSKKVFASHMHNEGLTKVEILENLKKGMNIGLVTDRGTPTISDPGYQVVKYVAENNFNVVCLPGATAFVPALAVSGLNTDRFIFYGFLNSKESARNKELIELENEEKVIIIYEAPHRIIKTLNNMFEIFGDRYISISREISKRYEEVYRGKISDVVKEIVNPKGEFVIVISGNINLTTNISIEENINLYIKQGFSAMESIKKTAKERKMSKNDVYNLYHKIEGK